MNSHDVSYQKKARFDAARAKAQQFLDEGGDLKSKEAVPIGVEFIEAFNDLAKELSTVEEAVEPAPPSPTMQDLLKLFTLEKKKDVERYCRELVIQQRDFVDFILSCEIGQTPFIHIIHHGDHLPAEAELMDSDLAALGKATPGPLDADAQKTVRKISHLFRVRRYLVGHIFYKPDLSQWHFFQFDQRDLDDSGPNHWKEGTHVHFINWLWPQHDAKTLWENFTAGKAKMNDSVHVRFRVPPTPNRFTRSPRRVRTGKNGEVAPK